MKYFWRIIKSYICISKTVLQIFPLDIFKVLLYNKIRWKRKRRFGRWARGRIFERTRSRHRALALRRFFVVCLWPYITIIPQIRLAWFWISHCTTTLMKKADGLFVGATSFPPIEKTSEIKCSFPCIARTVTFHFLSTGRESFSRFFWFFFKKTDAKPRIGFASAP